MGRRGPSPHPTALKVARGVRSDRINANEPKAVEGGDASPFKLDELAQAEWDRMIPILRAMGVWSAGDGVALALYCVTFSQWRKAQTEIATNGYFEADARGRRRRSPYVAISNRSLSFMTRMLKEFGLTPSSRSSVNARPDDESDEIDQRFLRRRKRPPG